MSRRNGNGRNPVDHRSDTAWTKVGEVSLGSTTHDILEAADGSGRIRLRSARVSDWTVAEAIAKDCIGMRDDLRRAAVVRLSTVSDILSSLEWKPVRPGATAVPGTLEIHGEIVGLLYLDNVRIPHLQALRLQEWLKDEMAAVSVASADDHRFLTALRNQWRFMNHLADTLRAASTEAALGRRSATAPTAVWHYDHFGVPLSERDEGRARKQAEEDAWAEAEAEVSRLFPNAGPNLSIGHKKSSAVGAYVSLMLTPKVETETETNIFGLIEAAFEAERQAWSN